MRIVGIAVMAAGIAWGAPGWLQAGMGDKKGQELAAAPMYKPPLRGTPGGRIGGGTRSGTGNADQLATVLALAPNHTGFTSTAQPDLFWYLSDRVGAPIEFTLSDERATAPVVEKRIESPARGGIQRVRLKDMGVQLEPGVSYRWFVAVIMDAGRRSRDVLAGGMIQRTELPADVGRRLKAAPAEAPRLYAEAGYWYDSIQALSDAVDAEPGNPAPRAQRAALLEQVNLPQIVAAERPHP
jgi:hypothetical protein